MTTLKEFWQSLNPDDKDYLRKLVAVALFVSTTTMSAYGSGAREVPKAKQGTLKALIKIHYKTDIVFTDN